MNPTGVVVANTILTVCLVVPTSFAQSWGGKSGSSSTPPPASSSWGRSGRSGTWGSSQRNPQNPGGWGGWGTGLKPGGWGTGQSGGWPQTTTRYEYKLVPRYEWVTESGSSGPTVDSNGTISTTDSANAYRKLVGYDRVRVPVGTQTKPNSGSSSGAGTWPAADPGRSNRLPAAIVRPHPLLSGGAYPHRNPVSTGNIAGVPVLKTNTIPSAKPAAPATNSLPPAKRATLEANPVPAFALSDDEDWQSSEEYHNAEEMYEDSFGTMSDVDADAENDVVEVPHFGDSAEEEVEADEEDESPISDDSQPSSNDTGDTRPTFPETSDPFSSTAPSDNSGSGSGAESGAGSGGKPLGNEAKPEDTLENEAKPEESLGNESKPPETLGNQAASEETQGDKPDGPSKPGTEKPGWPSSGTSNSPWPSSANGTSKPNTGGNAKPPDHWLPNVNDPPKPITQTKTPWYNPWASNRPGLKGGDLIIDPDPPIMNHNPPIDPKTGQPIKDRGVGIGIALPLTTEQSTSSPPPNLTPGDVKYQQALPPVKDPPKSPSFEGSMKVKVTTDDKGTQLMNDAVDTVFGVNPMRVMEKGVQSLVDGIERASSWLPKPSKKSTDDQPSTSTPSKMASDGKTSYTDGNERSVAEKEAAQKRRQKRDEEFRQSEHGKQFHKKHSHEPSDPAAAEEWKKERRQAVEEYRHEKAVKKWERSSDSEAFIRQYGPKPTDPAELEKWEKHRNEAMNPIKLESTVTEGGIRA